MNLNLLGDCTYYSINLLKLSEEKRKDLDTLYSIDSDCTEITCSENEIEKLEIPSEAVIYETGWIEETELQELLESYVGKHPYYLVYGEHMRWNGESGFMIANSVLQACMRNYDFTLRLIEDLGNDAILCIESSHDVPTGSKLYIIGINEEDEQMLEENDFENIDEFVQKYI